MAEFQKIVDRIGDALGVLDFSFIVSGGITFLMLVLMLHLHDIEFHLINNTITVVVGFLLSYVCGLFVWGLGKRIRLSFFVKSKRFDEIFQRTLSDIPDLRNDIRSLFGNNNNMVYSYMWMELQKDSRTISVMTYLNKQWTMQALFEGFIGTSLVGLVCLFYSKCHWCCEFSNPAFFFILLILVIIFSGSVYYAREYAEDQIKNVIVNYYSYIWKKERSVL